jgi:hypothetical protein
MLRNLARLVNARIRWAIATRDGMDAVHDWRVGFQMARHLQGDTTLNYLVRCGGGDNDSRTYPALGRLLLRARVPRDGADADSVRAQPRPIRDWEQRTRRRLMLIHLRLREYHLREGRYPDSLEPLNLQELAIDPFTGQPFVYRLIGERYQLESSV